MQFIFIIIHIILYIILYIMWVKITRIEKYWETHWDAKNCEINFFTKCYFFVSKTLPIFNTVYINNSTPSRARDLQLLVI